MGGHPPDFAKAGRLDPEKLEITELQKQNSCIWTTYAFGRLNFITTVNKYLLPNMQDLSNGLHDCPIFSKTDLKGYHQIL